MEEYKNSKNNQKTEFDKNLYILMSLLRIFKVNLQHLILHNLDHAEIGLTKGKKKISVGDVSGVIIM